MISKSFKRARQLTGLSQGDFAELCGWDQGRQSHYELGRRAPGEAEIKIASKVSGMAIADFFSDEEAVNKKPEATERGLPIGKYKFIPDYLGYEFSAGNGINEAAQMQEESAEYAISGYYNETRDLAFRSDWLSSIGLSQNEAIVVQVSGDSMMPRLYSGDKVLVKTSDTDVISGKVYALSYGGELKIKRLERKYDGTLIIRSDNQSPEYRDQEVPEHDLEHIQIIGRVIHLVSGGGF